VVTRLPQGGGLASSDENCDQSELKCVLLSVNILANFYCVMIWNNQLHDSNTQSSMAASMPFPKTHISMINHNIINSQHTPSIMNMNDVIILWAKHQREIQNITNQLQIITHPSTFQSNICTHPLCQSLDNCPGSAFHPHNDWFLAGQLLIYIWLAQEPAVGGFTMWLYSGSQAIS